MSQTLIRTDDRAPSRERLKPLKECRTLAEAFRTDEFMERIRMSVPQHISPERMLRTFIQATSKTPDLVKCNLRSVMGGMLTLSQLGLEPNTPLGQAYLIPFKGKERSPQTGKWDVEVYNLNVILGYQGLLDLSYRAPKFKSVQAQVVYKEDKFSFEYGTDAHVRHKPTGHYAEGEEPIWAYAHAALEDGQMFEVMSWADVIRIRNRSQGYQAALAAKENAESKGWNLPKAWTEAPWVRHTIAMGRKTAFRSLSKWLPRSAELAAAVALDERQDEETIDFGPVVDGADFTENELPGVEVDLPARPDAAFSRRSEPGSDQQDAAAGTRVAKQMPVDQPEGETPTQASGRASREVSVARGRTEPESAREHRIAREGEEARKILEETFEGWLTDEDGEPTSMEPITDPVAYARRVEEMWQTSRNREALLENNADSLDLAAEASADAKRIIDSMRGPKFPVVTIPEGRGSWRNYVDAIAAALHPDKGHGVTPDTLNEWAEIQAPGILRAPQAVRIGIVRIITEWAAAAKVDVPPVIAQALRTKGNGQQPAGAGNSKPEQQTSPQGTPGQDKGEDQPSDAAADNAGALDQTNPAAEEEKRRQEEADAKLDHRLDGFLDDLKQAASQAHKRRHPAEFVAFFEMDAVQRFLREVQSKGNGGWKRVLDTLCEEPAFSMVQELQTVAPGLMDAVMAHKVRPQH